MPYFNPLEQDLQPEYCRRLAKQGRMVTAMCVLGHVSDPETLFVLQNPNRPRPVLPLVDMAGYKSRGGDLSPAGYVSERLATRLGVMVAEGSLQFIPKVSHQDKYIDDMGQPLYDTHFRSVIPFIGLYEYADMDRPGPARTTERASQTLLIFQADYDRQQGRAGMLGASIEALEQYLAITAALPPVFTPPAV